MTPAEKLAANKPYKHHMPKPLKGRPTPWVCTVRETRESHRLSLDDVADAIGLSKAGLWQVEHGCDVMLTTAFKLAQFFGTTIEKLWPQLLLFTPEPRSTNGTLSKETTDS